MVGVENRDRTANGHRRGEERDDRGHHDHDDPPIDVESRRTVEEEQRAGEEQHRGDDGPRIGTAGLDVDRVPEHRDQDERQRPPVHGEVREADERTDQRHRARAAGEADRDREELEDDEGEAHDQQQVGNRRTRERVHRLPDEVEFAEPDLVERFESTTAAGADDLGRPELDRSVAVSTVCPLSATRRSPIVAHPGGDAHTRSVTWRRTA